MKSVSNVLMEVEFKEQLQRLRPTEETLSYFPRLAANLWEETQGDIEKQRNQISVRLAQAKRQKAALLEMRLNQELSREEFEEANNDYSQQIVAEEQELQSLDSVSQRQEAFIRFREVRLMDVASAWEKAGIESRARVQTILFSDGLSYDPKCNSLNSAKAALFNALTQEEVSVNQLGVPDGI